MTTTATSTTSGLWTPIAIEAAKKFGISQREKLNDLGALDQTFGPIQIVGEPIDAADGQGTTTQTQSAPN